MIRPGIHVAFVFLQIAAFAVFSVAEEKPQSKSVSSKDVASEVDRQILAELQKAGVTVAARCSDEDFLRRVSLDITGQLPSPSDVIAFRQNNDPDKRAALIDKLADSSEFGLNWARYWRDVIYFRATEQRSRFNQ